MHTTDHIDTVSRKHALCCCEHSTAYTSVSYEVASIVLVVRHSSLLPSDNPRNLPFLSDSEHGSNFAQCWSIPKSEIWEIRRILDFLTEVVNYVRRLIAPPSCHGPVHFQWVDIKEHSNPVKRINGLCTLRFSGYVMEMILTQFDVLTTMKRCCLICPAAHRLMFQLWCR